MVRSELHRPHRAPDALSAPPPRPRLDAVAWNAERAEERRRAEAQTAEAVAALLAQLEAANRKPAEKAA